MFGLGLAGVVQAKTPAAAVEATDALQFAPKKITVSVGDTVRWNNTSVLVHSVTDVPAKAVDLPVLPCPKTPSVSTPVFWPPGADYAHRFTEPGTYRYFCIPHEAAGTVGTVVVKPKD